MRSRWSAALVVAALLSSCSAFGGSGKREPAAAASDHGSINTTKVDPRALSTSLPGVIAFTSNWPTEPELQTLDLDAGSRRRIGGNAWGVGARFSPDGRRLAYARTRTMGPGPWDVFVLDLQTNQERKVGSGSCPTWTRDGKALLVGKDRKLVRLSLDGSATVIPGAEDSCGLEVGVDRVVLWFQGEHLDLLDHGRRRAILQLPRCGIGSVAADSTGRRIAYTVSCMDLANPNRGLWVMDLSSRRTTKLMHGSPYGASWSPDDRWVATELGFKRSDGTFQHDLWIACVAGCGRAKILAGGAYQPTWGPRAKAA